MDDAIKAPDLRQSAEQGIAQEMRHATRRMRHETRRRLLTVSKVDQLTPRMLRINLNADSLGDFFSAAFDDHIKLLFPAAAGENAGKPWMRDFTPRAFDQKRKTLLIDFALHEAGPAVDWALRAKPGDQLEIGGPRGSHVVPDDFDWTLLIGDETALPAIGRRVEEARARAPVTTVVVVADASETQTFATRADWTPIWVFRDGRDADDAALLREALTRLALPPGEGFVWIAAEAAVARSLRSYMLEERGQPKIWTKAAGYWQRGATAAHERIED